METTLLSREDFFTLHKAPADQCGAFPAQGVPRAYDVWSVFEDPCYNLSNGSNR